MVKERKYHPEINQIGEGRGGKKTMAGELGVI